MLVEGGLLAFEVGYDQGEAVAVLCRDASLSQVGVHKDLAGRERVVMARMGASGIIKAAAKKPLGKVGRFGLASARKPERSHRAGIPFPADKQ